MITNKHCRHLAQVMALLVFSTISYAGINVYDKSQKKDVRINKKTEPKRELVLFVRWGKGNSDIEYRTHDNKRPRSYYENPIAANSFWVGENDEIYILDGGQKIKIYKNGAFVRTIRLPQLGFLQDFVVLNSGFVLNSSHEAYKVGLDGKLLNKKSVFGLARRDRAILELILLNDKIALTSDEISIKKPDTAPAYRCLSGESLEVVDCAPNTNLLAVNQVLDTDGSMYLSQDYDSGVLKITPLSGGQSYYTTINTYSYLDKFDGQYRFVCYKPFRIRGDYLYYVITGKDGLRIEKVQYRNIK
ncbi:MAG TPA: hypothetical protein VMV48_07480 [Gallionellaceae bacterium]|nr:hypothetical protein [Gallionellaceae bacterium]